MNSARLSSATTRAPSFSNAAMATATNSLTGLSAGKLSILQPKILSKTAILSSGPSSGSSSNMNSAQSIVAHRLDLKGSTESRRSFVRVGGDGGDSAHMRNGSMHSIMTDISDHDSNPEVKYRAIRNLKLVAYDDANVLMGRHSLQNTVNDIDYKLDPDPWSQKETKSSWIPIPGQNLNRWNGTT